MSKTLYFAGISRVAGELKFRTATEPSRFQQLTKLGDTDVEFVRITATESKAEAACELLNRNFANGRTDIVDLLNRVADKTPVPKAKQVIKVNAKKASIKKSSTLDDDAPLTRKQAEKLREEFNARVKIAYEAN